MNTTVRKMVSASLVNMNCFVTVATPTHLCQSEVVSFPGQICSGNDTSVNLLVSLCAVACLYHSEQSLT